MKKFIKKLNSVMLLSIILVMAACSNDDFLNRIPQDTPSPENFFVDAVSARAAVNGAYRPWTQLDQLLRRDMIILLDAMTDDSYWRPNRAQSIRLEQWNINPTQINVIRWWGLIYQSINAANFAIENIPLSSDQNFTAEEQAPFIAEARFLRAYNYLFLTTFYGDIPMPLKAASTPEAFFLPRTPKADIMAQIVADFTFAKDNLLDAPALAGTPFKASAAAFLAKTYLYLEDWAKAEAAARVAITMAEDEGYGLLDDYLSIWNNEDNKELLFYFPFAKNDPNFGQNMTVQRLILDLPNELTTVQPGQGWGYSLPQRDLFDAFEPGDPRREYTLYYPGADYTVWPNTEEFVSTYETYNDAGELVEETATYRQGDIIKYQQGWSPTGLNVRKMTRSVSDLGNVRWSGQDIPIMRMAELYLILAEALAEQGNSEALTWVNRVRSRPSVNMPDAIGGDLVGIVRQERRVELAMEGLRVFDLIRWGTIGEVFGDGTKVKRHFFSDFLDAGSNLKFDAPVGNLTLDPLFPTPQLEIDRNPEINTQVPGF